MIRLLIVEDHALVREGLARLLRQIEDEVEIRECANFEAALELLYEDADYDLVLLDLALPGIDGFTGLDVLRKRFPALPVVVVSAFDDQPTINRVINRGASGFIPKSYGGDAILAGVRCVLAGNIYLPGADLPVAQLDDEPPLPPAEGRVQPMELGLTARQAQVLALMVKGRSNREIAEQLDLSEGTVKIHATAIFKTLGVSSRTQALVVVSRYSVDFEGVLDN